jgi:hypothetical protein
MNLNELRKKHEELIKGKSSASSGENADKYLKVEMGKNTIRILPWKDESKAFYAEAVMHRYVDEEGKFKSYYCRKTQNESCPLCDFYFELWKTHNSLGLGQKAKSKYGDFASKIKGNPRYYMNVVDRRHLDSKKDDASGAIKIFSTGQKVLKKVLDGLFNPEMMDESDPENTNVLSLKKGNDFVLELGKSGEFNNYDQSTFRIKKTPAGTDREIKIFMDSLHDIHGMIKIGDYDEGKRLVEFFRISLDDAKSPSRDSDDDMGETRFKKEVQV